MSAAGQQRSERSTTTNVREPSVPPAANERNMRTSEAASSPSATVFSSMGVDLSRGLY